MTPFALAQRYIGIREIAGDKNHPLVQWWLSLCGFALDTPDEVPWCSAFVNGICWEFRLPRSKSAAARSWLTVGLPTIAPEPGYDIVVLARGDNPALGHVGFYAAHTSVDSISIVGGNQHNGVSLETFASNRVLGIRHLSL